MPNRIIKESICVSEQIDELNPFEETFFYRLLVNCDDYGCMDAREKVLVAKLFPLKAVKAADILKALVRLAEVDLIGLYDVNGHPYLKVLKWSDHQRVRVSKHKYPEPTEEQLSVARSNLRQLAATCGETRRIAANRGNLRPESNPIQSNPNPNTNPNPNPNPNPPTDTDANFDRFWASYPKRVARQDAMKAWKKINPDTELVEMIIDKLEKWKASDEWNREGGQYVPHAATWLNGRRWDDEVPEKKDAPAARPAPVKQVVAQQYTQRTYDDEQSAALRRMIASARGEGVV